MEILSAELKHTYYTHEVSVKINGKTIIYEVVSCFRDGKKYVCQFRRINRVQLTSSERRQLKQYFETEFIN